MHANTRLEGRTAVVTGAAGGIGKVIALGLARSGARVALTSRDRERLTDTAASIRVLGQEPLLLELDIRDAGAVAASFTTVEEELGTPDVVVANSGIGGPTAPLWDVTVDDLDTTLGVNVRGTFLTVQAGLSAMVRAGRGGSIVVIGSMTGKRPLAHRSPYAMSKAALIGLVRTAALDAGPHGIRVNLVSPGFVEGDRLDWVIEGQATATEQAVDRVRQDLANRAPLQRFVPPQDVADTVAFLAGDAAGSITGADLNVSAGLVMY